MNIEKRVVVHLSKDDVEKIVREYVKTNITNGVEPTSISFNVSSHLEGFGMSEFPVNTFDGCNVVCNDEKDNK